MKTPKVSRLFSIVVGSILILGALPAALARAPTYDIRNALRPGAKAMHCPAMGETPDGCTFHTPTGGVNQMRLPVVPGSWWIVSSPDSDLLDIHEIGEQSEAKGVRVQVFDLAPRGTRDADLTVTFDRLIGARDGFRVVERRRVNIMKHSVESWNEK